MAGIRQLVFLFYFVLRVSSEEKSFDPNAVSHTTKSQLIKSIEAGNEESLIYFCK